MAIMELASRIMDLEARDLVVHRTRITVLNRYGEEVKVMRYWMGDSPEEPDAPRRPKPGRLRTRLLGRWG